MSKIEIKDQNKFSMDSIQKFFAAHVSKYHLAALAGGAVLASSFFVWMKLPLLKVAYSLAKDKLASIFLGTKEERLVKHVAANAEHGNPQSVLDTIDSWAWSDGHWMMNVGNVKGTILDHAIEAAKPKVAIELGGYCGYSAVRIGRLLPDGAKLYSIEVNPTYAAIATQMIKIAGLQNKCKVIVADSGEALKNLKYHIGHSTVDLVFIDHWKHLYLRDFQLMEEHGILHPGSYVVADNVIYPGTPEYLAYVRANPAFTSTFYEAKLEYSNDIIDGIEVSVKK